MSSKKTEITIDGVTYIPVKEAALLADYTADYLGQLCRAGKLESTKIGRAWYVSEESVISHKEAQELGESNSAEEQETEEEIVINRPVAKFSPKSIFKESSFIVYHKDESPLIPTLKPVETEVEVKKSAPRVSEIAQEKPENKPENVPPKLLEGREQFPLLLNFLRKTGSVFSRVLLFTTSFAIVFLLIFSLNGSYTRSLIGNAISSMSASVSQSEVGNTVESDLIQPFRESAIEFNRIIDEKVYDFVYGEVIYDTTGRR